MPVHGGRPSFHLKGKVPFVTSMGGGITPSGGLTTQATIVSTPAFYGYGAQVTGGNNQPHVFVTHNGDTGTGSLRWAVAQNNVFVDFSSLPSNQTTITTSDSYLDMGTGNITIAGETAPSPGITILGRSLRRTGSGANYIIRNIRHRSGLNSPYGDVDCITFIRPTITGVLIHNCSLSGIGGGETLGFWDGVYDVTVQDNIIGQGNTNSRAEVVNGDSHNYGFLIGASGPPNSIPCQRLSIFRNLMWRIDYRSPAVGWMDTPQSGEPNSSATSIVADVANNIIWEYGFETKDGNGNITQHGTGTSVYYGAAANVRSNYYFSAIGFWSGNRLSVGPLEIYSPNGASHMYTSGNYSKNGFSFIASNSPGGVPYSVPTAAVLPIGNAQTVAAAMLGTVGCRVGGLDAFDTAAIAQINSTGL